MNQTGKYPEIVKQQNKQLFIQLQPEQTESIADFCSRFANLLRKSTAHIIRMSCFGSLESRENFETELKLHTHDEFPITWVEGENCSDSFLNGIQVWAFDAEIIYLQTDFNARACLFEDELAHYLFLGDVLSATDNPETLAYSELLIQVNTFLNQHGFLFTDVHRTWYFLDHILSWYDGFNRVRTDFFRETGVIEKGLPASTAVSGRNKMGSAVTMELFAIRPKNDSLQISRVKSPLQNEANDYGSSFSRGVRIFSKGATNWMSISGTASILPNGETVHLGDIEKQISYSFEVVQGMLRSEGFEFSDVVRATAYLKDKTNLPVLLNYLQNEHQNKLPVVISENTVCRENLLFELEMDLMKNEIV